MTFKIVDQRELEDIQSTGIIYEHEQTGAQVLYLKNQDTNKAFTIGFRTPPVSDNGVTHILEHSVLNGSKKYPSKEPFVELVKGSLNTFINAMTFSDKTIYPVASTNEKDFENLMSVYLDAVFAPKMLEDPQILAQEGWHYHLESAEDDLIYKGVVYNEMKGANASPERQLGEIMNQVMFKGTPYQWNSGGDASSIPSLTQADFVNYHQTYYHPSNSLTVIYGDLDMDKVLEKLAEYFDQYERQSHKIDFTTRKAPGSHQVIQETYSLTEGDSPEDKDFLAVAWYVATPDELIEGFGLTVLQEILLGNNQAPLKKALLDAGIGGDIDGGYQDLGYPRVFEVIAKYSDADKMPEFQAIIQNTLQDLVEKGIDPDLVQASLNKIIFQLKELVISESSPRGIIYTIEALQTWLYGLSPFGPLEFTKYLTKIKNIVDQGYFEKLIEQKLLNNASKVEIILTGEPGKSDALEAAKLEQLQEYKASLSEDEIAQLVEQTQTLISRQNAPDTEEDLAKIPSLTKEDLTTETEVLPLDFQEFYPGTLFYHASQFTSGIDYLKFHIDLKDIEREEFAWMKLLSSLLGKLDTASYSANDLQTQIDLYTGGIFGSIRTYTTLDKEIKPYFVFSGKALEEYGDKLVALMKEILLHTQFDREEDILKIVHRSISGFEQQINYSAHALAANRALSHVDPSANLAESYDGLDYFKFLKEIRQQLQAGEAGPIIDHLQATLIRLLNKARLNVLYIGSQARANVLKDLVHETFEGLDSAPLGPVQEYPAAGKKDEAFVTSQDVNYVALATETEGVLDYSGHQEVLANILRYSYLWNNVRVKGGAYGAMFGLKMNGYFTFTSYRDPNIEQTINTYLATPEYIADLKLSEDELVKSMIGTMSALVRPLSAFDKGMKAFAMQQTGLNAARELRIKEEVLSTSAADLTALSSGYEQVLQDASIVVIGNKAQIDKNRDKFDLVQELY